jgi:ribonuclease HII
MMGKFDPACLPPSPTLEFELSLWEAGFKRVAGIDEAGRGPLAGPVSAAAVILPNRPEVGGQLSGVRDSKQMSPVEREAWAPTIKALAWAYGLGFASALEIDRLGILPATRLAVRRALDCLPQAPDHLLLDYLQLPDFPAPQTSLVKGDVRSLSIAAASVLAKTSRDALLCDLDLQYPGYGFSAHKGYGTSRHRAALAHLGPCPIHRRSFKGVSQPEDSE